MAVEWIRPNFGMENSCSVPFVGRTFYCRGWTTTTSPGLIQAEELGSQPGDGCPMYYVNSWTQGRRWTVLGYFLLHITTYCIIFFHWPLLRIITFSIFTLLISVWGWGLKSPHCGSLLSSIFDNSGKNNGQATFVTFALRFYNSYNHATHAHAPGQQTWPSPGSAESKWSKTVEVGCSS